MSGQNADQNQAAIAFLEVSAGAALASLIPVKILIQHLIKTGLVDRQAFYSDLESGLNLDLYQGETRAMLEPIWTSLKKEIGHG